MGTSSMEQKQEQEKDLEQELELELAELVEMLDALQVSPDVRGKLSEEDRTLLTSFTRAIAPTNNTLREHVDEEMWIASLRFKGPSNGAVNKAVGRLLSSKDWASLTVATTGTCWIRRAEQDLTLAQHLAALNDTLQGYGAVMAVWVFQGRLKSSALFSSLDTVQVPPVITPPLATTTEAAPAVSAPASKE